MASRRCPSRWATTSASMSRPNQVASDAQHFSPLRILGIRGLPPDEGAVVEELIGLRLLGALPAFDNGVIGAIAREPTFIFRLLKLLFRYVGEIAQFQLAANFDGERTRDPRHPSFPFR